MPTKEKKKAVAAAALAVAAAVSQHYMQACEAAAWEEVNSKRRRVSNGRYLIDGGIPSVEECHWACVDQKGDDLEFLHFLALTRASFEELLSLCSPEFNSNSLSGRYGKPRDCDLKRRKHSNRELLAMTLKYLVSTAEHKDLHVHFGANLNCFCDAVRLGMQVIVKVLTNNPKARVKWDRSKEACAAAAAKTSQFLDIPGVVSMIDGTKFKTLSPPDTDDQNRDFNGWHHCVYRNILCVWDPDGKIVDVAVNLPGNFHDSKSALWCQVYDHVAKLPDGFRCVCDDAFKTQGNLEGKLVKTKTPYKEGDPAPKSGYDQALTHLRQCSEWGNNVLTGVYRRLKTSLPTDNVTRATIMWSCILLHNWRTVTVGRNQIKTYFDYINKQDDDSCNE